MPYLPFQYNGTINDTYIRDYVRDSSEHTKAMMKLYPATWRDSPLWRKRQMLPHHDPNHVQHHLHVEGVSPRGEQRDGTKGGAVSSEALLQKANELMQKAQALTEQAHLLQRGANATSTTSTTSRSVAP